MKLGLSRRRWRQLLGVLAMVFIALLFALRTERAGAFVCATLREKLPQATGAAVELGRCVIDPLTASVEVSGVSVTLPKEPGPLVTAESARVALRGLFFGGVSLQDVTLTRPQVTLSLPIAMEGGGECPLKTITHLRVGRLAVHDGALTLKLPQGREVKVDGLQVEGALGRSEAQLRVDARGGQAVIGEGLPVIRIGRVAVEATGDLLAESAEVQRAEVNVEGVKLTASGLIDALCDPAPMLDLSVHAWLPMESIPRLGVALPSASGQLLARVQVTGRADAPRAQGEIQASKVALGEFTPGDFSVRAGLKGSTLTVDEFFTRVGDGEVRVSAQVELSGHFPMKATVETREVSLARTLARASITGSWVDLTASVKGAVSGTLKPIDFGGDIDFRTGPFVLATRAYDAPQASGLDILRFKQAGGRFRFGVNAGTISFNDADVRVGVNDNTRINATVKLGIGETLRVDLDAHARSLELSDFGALAELPIAGTGEAKVRVTRDGNGVLKAEGHTTLRDMKLAGYSLGVVQTPVRYLGDVLSFPSVAAQKGHTQYFGDVALDFAPAELHALATAQVPDGRVEDIIDLLADLSPSLSNIQDGVLTGRLGAVVKVDCPVSALNGTIAANLRDVRYLQRRLGGGGLIAHFEDGDALTVSPTTFTGPLGTTRLDGRWRFEGPLDFRASIDDGALAELVDPLSEMEQPPAGAFTARARVSGTTDVTVVDGRLDSPAVRWKQRSLGVLALTAHSVGRQVGISGQVIDGVQGELSIFMKDEWPYTATASATLNDLTPFLPQSAAGVQAALTGVGTFHGPLRHYERSKAELTLSRLTIARGEVSVANVGPVVLGLDDGAYVVKAARLEGATTEFEAQGAWGPKLVNLKSRGSVDLRLVSTLAPQLERAQGLLDFTAAFSGPVERPAIAGNASLRDARFSWRGQDVAVRALSGRADFSESRVLVHDLHGFLNDGRVRGRGDVRLDGLKISTFEFQTDIEDATVQVKPEVPVTLTGSLLLSSRGGEHFSLQGGLDVVKFRYTQPMALETLVANAAQSTEVPDDTQPDEWLKLDVDLRTAGDVRIENDLARARLNGRVKLTGTNVKPVLVGTVETQDGAQAWFRGNTFAVQRGQLQFNGLWPTFQLDARTQVREFLIGVKAFGRIEDPRVAFSSEPSLPDADILALLTIGVTSRERIDVGAGAGLAAEALLTASGLDQQLQRFLKENVGLKEQQVKLTTSFNEITGTAEPAVSWESKILNDNLKVGVVQPVTGRGTRAQIEYQIDKNVSARAQWDNQNQNTTVGNPGVELKFRFEWE